MGMFFSFGFPAQETHEGYVLCRLPTGELVSIVEDDAILMMDALRRDRKVKG